MDELNPRALVRRIRACEGETAAQLLLESILQAAHTRAEAETVRRCVEAVRGDYCFGAASAIRAAFPHVKD